MDHGTSTKNDQINSWLAELNDALHSGLGSTVELPRQTMLNLARLVRRQRLDVINAEEATLCAREDHSLYRRRSLETHRRLLEALKHYTCNCEQTCGLGDPSPQYPCGLEARRALEEGL